MTRWAIVAILLATPWGSGRQPPAVLRGQVVDRQSRSAVVNAIVRLDGRNDGPRVDSSGRFQIPAPPAHVSASIRIRAIGYDERVIARPRGVDAFDFGEIQLQRHDPSLDIHWDNFESCRRVAPADTARRQPREFAKVLADSAGHSRVELCRGLGIDPSR